MRPSELSSILASEVRSVAEYLLPNGKEHRGEWEVGSIGGEEGKSLKIRLTGEKKGKWTDFATDTGGDLIDLWKDVKGCDIVTAMKESSKFVGVSIDEPHRKIRVATPPSNVAKPEKSKMLLESRGLTPETIDAFKIQDAGKDIYFPYHSPEGELVMYKNRDNKKNMWASKDTDPCLFGWQALRHDSRSVIICEGEIDAMSWWQAGYDALSLPFGGGSGGKHKWFENESHNLESFDFIYLSMDMDEVGQQTKHTLVNMIGKHRCFLIDLPLKDANDCLQKGINLSEYYKKAVSLDPPELLSTAGLYEDTLMMLYPPDWMDKGMMTPWASVGDQLRFRNGEVTVWTGINGHGKTMVIGNLMMDAIACQGYNVCIASMEMSPERQMIRNARQLGGIKDPSSDFLKQMLDLMDYRYIPLNVKGNVKGKTILDHFRFARARYNCTQFVIDSLAKCGFGVDDYNAQKNFVDELTDFAKTNNIHIHLVVHPRKGMDEMKPPSKQDVGGSGAVTDMVDNVMIVYRNKRKEAIKELAHKGMPISEKEEKWLEEADTKIICCKQRNGDWEGTIRLHFDIDSYRYYENPELTGRDYFSALEDKQSE